VTVPMCGKTTVSTANWEEYLELYVLFCVLFFHLQSFINSKNVFKIRGIGTKLFWVNSYGIEIMEKSV
jgi:hypothetical protein